MFLCCLYTLHAHFLLFSKAFGSFSYSTQLCRLIKLQHLINTIFCCVLSFDFVKCKQKKTFRALKSSIVVNQSYAWLFMAAVITPIKKCFLVVNHRWVGGGGGGR